MERFVPSWDSPLSSRTPRPLAALLPPTRTPPTPSGTYITDPEGDFAVWVTINGTICRAYHGVTVYDQPYKPRVSCLLEIELGKTFQIHVDTTGYSTRRRTILRARQSCKTRPPKPLDLSAEPDLEVRLSVDGRWIKTNVVGASAQDRVTTFSGASISDTVQKAFKFTDPRMYQSPKSTSAIMPNAKPKTPTATATATADVGTLKVSIHRVRRGDPTQPWIPGKPNGTKIPSDGAYGAITCYDQRIPLPVPERYYIVRRLAEDKTTPICCFEVGYHTAEGLRAIGVVSGGGGRDGGADGWWT